MSGGSIDLIADEIKSPAQRCMPSTASHRVMTHHGSICSVSRPWPEPARRTVGSGDRSTSITSRASSLISSGKASSFSSLPTHEHSATWRRRLRVDTLPRGGGGYTWQVGGAHRAPPARRPPSCLRAGGSLYVPRARCSPRRAS